MITYKSHRKMDENDILTRHGSNSRARLAYWKKKAAATVNPDYANWRKLRGSVGNLAYHGFPGNWNNPYKNGVYFASKLSALPGRFVGYADEIEYSTVNHSGWFTDDMQDGKLRGLVMQLPAKNGTPRYYPAIESSDWDTVTAWPLENHDRARDAASSADREAEIAAEKEREYYEKDQAEQRVIEARELIRETKRELLQLLREYRPFRKSAKFAKSSLCDVIRARINSHLQEIAEAREIINNGGVQS
jgi:hypothetical protein